MADTIEGLADNISNSSPNEFATNVNIAGKEGPKYNKDGSFKKSKKSNSSSRVEIADEPTEPLPSYTEMGNVMAVTICSSCTMLLGQEWKPESQELDAIGMAWAKYFESTGLTQFPPWLMLTMVHAGYVGKRLTMPETQSRWARIKYSVARWRYKRRYGMYPEDINRDATASPNQSPFDGDAS